MKTTTSKALMTFMRQGLSAKTLLAFTSSLVTSLRGNTNFPGQDPALDALERKLSEFQRAYDTAQTGTSADKAKAQTIKGEIQKMIKPICENVNFIAKGSRDMLLTTSFKLNKDIRTLIVLEPVQNFKVNAGNNPGELCAGFKTQKGLKGIVFQYTYDANPTAGSNWISVSSSKQACTLSNLTPGKVVAVRVVLSAARSQIVYSQMITTVVGFGKQ